jgi:pimeloyl-ACP methyl ester carboxylesterase
MRPLNVFVYGGGPASGVVTDYSDTSLKRSGLVSRQSLISAMTGPSGASVAPKSSLRPSEMRQINADLRGSLPDDLAGHAQDIDFVLMDLFDERFGVDQIEDGSYLTRTPARVKHVIVGFKKSRFIAFGSDEHFELWSDAADKYVELLRQLGLLSVTFLLDTPWAESDENGEDAELPYGLVSADANLAFTRYVDHLRRGGIQAVRQPETSASSQHRWGRAPFNFHDRVYHAVTAKLSAAVRDTRVGSLMKNDFNWDERHQAETLRWTSIDQFDGGRTGRTHHVVAPSDQAHNYPLRCLVQNSNSDTLLVISHGALPRTKYSLPRFEWLASLEARTENLMFLADTALEPFDELELAWFTGNAQDDLTRRYADLVSRAADQLGADKVLFLGGSGGGFASLALASHSPGSRALVFNPQTNIQKYWNKSVRQYADHLFPEFESLNQIGRLGGRTNMVARYATHPTPKSQIIYVQNDDDSHHVENHLRPFAATFGMQPESGVAKNGAIRLIVDHFASGHNMPYRRVLNPFVDLALANWGASLDLGPQAPEDLAISQTTAEIDADKDPSSRVAT